MWTLRFTENGMTTLHSPFEQHVTDAYIQKGIEVYNNTTGKASHNPDVNLVGLYVCNARTCSRVLVSPLFFLRRECYRRLPRLF